ncbi:c-type cytochrome [Aestuariivirga sp.]|uniref:c-type cytochrome n=1 Tax=Aestuariivirga sp. TaxID=2650926 RepID=UPI00391C4514
MRLEGADRLIFRFIMGVVALVFAAALLGFVIVPTIQGQRAGLDIWTSVCRALGIAPGSPSAATPESVAQAQPSSTVAWTTFNINALARPNQQVAQDLAQNLCAACHGENGVSPSPDFPHLSGQSALAIYKQLHDYKSGARFNAQMTPVAQQLDEEQMLAVANHYATLARGTLDRRLDWTADPATDVLVRTGDTARGIPGCQSCHGAGAGGPMDTPTLSGQREAYLVAQMNAFATGARQNDVFNRMRDIAVRLTPQEIAALARYYATQ